MYYSQIGGSTIGLGYFPDGQASDNDVYDSVMNAAVGPPLRLRHFFGGEPVIQQVWSRDAPLRGMPGHQAFPELGMIHLIAPDIDELIMEPAEFITYVEGLESDEGPSEHIRQLRVIYRLALDQRRVQRRQSGGYSSRAARPSHYNTRLVAGSEVRILINTQDVDNAVEAIDYLTDLILENHWSVTANTKKFFDDVFNSAIDMAQGIYENQRVSGKQMRAIANWTSGVERCT